MLYAVLALSVLAVGLAWTSVGQIMLGALSIVLCSYFATKAVDMLFAGGGSSE